MKCLILFPRRNKTKIQNIAKKKKKKKKKKKDRVWHFMPIVSGFAFVFGAILHEKSNPVFWAE